MNGTNPQRTLPPAPAGLQRPDHLSSAPPGKGGLGSLRVPPLGGRAQDPQAALQLQGEQRAAVPAWGGVPWTPGGSDLAACFPKGLNPLRTPGITSQNQNPLRFHPHPTPRACPGPLPQHSVLSWCPAPPLPRTPHCKHPVSLTLGPVSTKMPFLLEGTAGDHLP